MIARTALYAILALVATTLPAAAAQQHMEVTHGRQR